MLLVDYWLSGHAIALTSWQMLFTLLNSYSRLVVLECAHIVELTPVQRRPWLAKLPTQR